MEVCGSTDKKVLVALRRFYLNTLQNWKFNLFYELVVIDDRSPALDQHDIDVTKNDVVRGYGSRRECRNNLVENSGKFCPTLLLRGVSSTEGLVEIGLRWYT